MIKTGIEKCQKVGSLDGKITQNWLKTPTFSFSRKIIIFKGKQKAILFFCYKNINTYNLHAFKIKK